MKALFTVGGHIFDITGCVANVTASKDGELNFRGNGLRIFRPNHVDGDAIIFIKFVGKEQIFGEWVNTYTVTSNWKSWDYSDYDMSTEEGQQVIHGLVCRLLNDCCAI